MRKLSVAIAVAIICAGTATVAAQPESRRQAAAHAKRGKELEKQKKHLAAVEQFQRAYALVPHPAMFYNIALNYRLSGRWTEALDYYQKYLAISPQGQLADIVRKTLPGVRVQAATDAEKRRVAAERESARQQRARALAKQREADLVRQREIEAAARGRAERQFRERERRRGPAVLVQRTSGGGLKVAGYFGAAIGVVLVGLGIKSGFDARRISDELSTQRVDPWTAEELAKQAEGKASERNLILFSSIGGAAIIGGGVAYLLGRRAALRAERISVSPFAAPDRVGWALTGRF